VVQVNASGVVQIDGPPVLGFVYTNNLSKYGNYGITGQPDTDRANTAIKRLPAGIGDHPQRDRRWAGRSYPAGKQFPFHRTVRDAVRLFCRRRLRLIAGSPWRSAGTDGQDLGAPLGGVAASSDASRVTRSSHDSRDSHDARSPLLSGASRGPRASRCPGSGDEIVPVARSIGFLPSRRGSPLRRP